MTAFHAGNAGKAMQNRPRREKSAKFLFPPGEVVFLSTGELMNLEEALKLIKESCEKMNSRYGKVVFDEWVIVSFAEGKEKILAYAGPRRDHFKQNFADDIKTLRKALFSEPHNIGDFDFSHQGAGTSFDAFIVLGESIFLLWNSTNESTTYITKNPNWLVAQNVFAELTDKFRKNPLTEPQ
jgi:hypothetical protein